MRNGNFSPAEIAKEGNITASGGPPGQLNATHWRCIPGGIIPSTAIDPNMQALMKLYPHAECRSRTPPAATTTCRRLHFNQNNTQWMSRVDYSISDNTKLFVRYNLQRETAAVPGRPLVAQRRSRFPTRRPSRARTAPTPSPPR